MKQKIFTALFSLMLVLMLIPMSEVSAASKKTASKKVTSITISNVTNKKLTVQKGRTYNLKAVVKPSNATNKKLKWTTSNSKIVTVSSSGKLTAKKNGTAKITATARDGSKKKTTITVTVGTRVSSIKIKNKPQQLLVGKSFKIRTTVGPSKANNKSLIYSSSNTKVATVSKNGLVRAVGVPNGKTSGTATITVKSADGGAVKATLKVTVKQPVTKIEANQAMLYLDKNEAVEAGYSVAPSNANSKKVTFTSDNPGVATVSATGTINSIEYGTANITVASTDGSKVSTKITVNVVQDLVKITVPSYTQKLIVDEKYTIKPTVTTSRTEPVSIVYTSSNPQVLTVTADGEVKAVGSGTATVSLSVMDVVQTPVTMSFEIKESSQVAITKKNFAAHMGLNKVAPSNSLPAFEKAGASGGFMGIETDVRETKDGEFVLIHDDDISSRTNKSGKVSTMTLAQIRKATMDVGSNISSYKNLKIPTLEEYLAICKTYGVKPVLHIKSVSNYKNLLQKLKDADMYNQVIITGSKATMTKIREIDKKVDLYWLCNMSVSGIDWAAANNIHINSDYTYVTQELIEYAHSKKLIVGAWTVNNEKTARKLIHKGVDFITTDYQWVK